MKVAEMKHAVKRQEWQERIIEYRSSGEPIRRWCKERGICVSTYYRWEREIFGQIGKKDSESRSLAVVVPEFAQAAVPGRSSTANQVVMTLRTGIAEVDIYAGAGEAEIEAVCRVLKLC